MPTSSVIRRSQVVNATERARVVVGPIEPAPQSVTVHREGEIVKAIEVQCRCGEHILIQCEYE